jgi:hypothetical protein
MELYVQASGAKAPRAILAGEAISPSEIQHIEVSELDLPDADARHFTAIVFNKQRLIFFDFRQNKLKASDLVERAEQFCASAKHAKSHGSHPLGD